MTIEELEKDRAELEQKAAQCWEVYERARAVEQNALRDYDHAQSRLREVEELIQGAIYR